MEENCIGNQIPQWSVVLEKKNYTPYRYDRLNQKDGTETCADPSAEFAEMNTVISPVRLMLFSSIYLGFAAMPL
jgi:hypothetical protein